MPVCSLSRRNFHRGKVVKISARNQKNNGYHASCQNVSEFQVIIDIQDVLLCDKTAKLQRKVHAVSPSILKGNLPIMALILKKGASKPA